MVLQVFTRQFVSDKKTILIVEDDPAEQELILAAFRANGVTNPLQVVNNGQEAIAYLMGDGKYADRAAFAYPTFILTDLKMPVSDGLSVLEHLKSNPEWATVPAVVLSGSGDADDVKKAYMLGARGYLQKPSSLGELRRRLRIVHEYWMTCETPAVDVTGRQIPTRSKGKVGERFPQVCGGKQRRRGEGEAKRLKAEG